jgi:transcriptional regulator with XRE-family HTH domain
MQMGEVIRQRRRDLGMSQSDLAQAAGVDARQIRRYETGDQQPLLTVAMAIADALQISVTELAGRPSHRVNVTGDWWASWQTYRGGEQKIATQPVQMRQEGDKVFIASTRRGLSAEEGGYMWSGELRLWDNEILTGWYAAEDGSIRSKGTMYLVMHPHGVYMDGRWVGLGYDDSIMTGWASMGKTSEDSEAAMTRLLKGEASRQ